MADTSYVKAPDPGTSLPTAPGLALLDAGAASRVLVLNGAGEGDTEAYDTVAITALSEVLGGEGEGDFVVSDGAGGVQLASEAPAAVREVLGVGGARVYTLADFTGEAGSESAPVSQGSGVYRFSVSANPRFYRGTYTYDGTTYSTANGNNLSAPRMRLALPANTVTADVRVRLVTHANATSWELPVVMIEDGTTMLHGVGCFALGDTNDVRAGDFLAGTYPLAGSAPTTALNWGGTAWLRLVWRDGQMTVYAGIGSGTAEPTQWERGGTVYTPSGRISHSPNVVIAATRPTNPSDGTAGQSGTFASWSVDLAARVYVWTAP